MKIWVMTKKQAVFLAAAIVVVITAMVVGKGGSVTVSGKQRDLPIYCVDKGDEKIASISFDAAWGAYQSVQVKMPRRILYHV